MTGSMSAVPCDVTGVVTVSFHCLLQEASRLLYAGQDDCVHANCALWCYRCCNSVFVVVNFRRQAGFCTQARMTVSMSTVPCDVTGVVTLYSLSTSGGGQASVRRPG